jgi:hypothetical protein
MKKHHLDCAYLVSKFRYHEKIKEELLLLIDEAEYNSPKVASAEVNITKADWYNATSTTREWFKYLVGPLTEQLKEMYMELGYDGFTIHEMWFQQYLQNSEHGWHSHSSNFTNVYFLELPEGTPKTQIVSPYDQKTVIEVDVQEGDLLIFPSFTLHKAPVNKSSKRKTIISYNIDATYSDKIYGKGIEI